MKAYDMDLRERVVAAYLAKEGTYEEVAERFCVSAAWVRKMVRQYRQLGHLRPQTHRCGRKPKLTEDDLQRLAKLADEEPDLTLEQFRARLGVACSLTTLWKALRRLWRTFKKDTAGGRTGPAGGGRRAKTASAAIAAAGSGSAGVAG